MNIENNPRPDQFSFKYYHLTEALEYIARKYNKDPDEMFEHIQEETETLGDEFLTFENHAGVVFDLLRKEFGEKTVYYDD